MNISSTTETEERRRSELLRDFFVTSLTLAFLKDLILSPAPAPVPVRVESDPVRERIPEYYRG